MQGRPSHKRFSLLKKGKSSLCSTAAAGAPLTGVGREVVPRRGGRPRPLCPTMAAGPTRVC